MAGVANPRHNRRPKDAARPCLPQPGDWMRIRACPSALRHCLRAFAAAIVIVALAVAGGRADDTITLTHQGVERTAVLHQAAGATRPAPLLIALQGLGQSTDALRNTLK